MPADSDSEQSGTKETGDQAGAMSQLTQAVPASTSPQKAAKKRAKKAPLQAQQIDPDMVFEKNTKLIKITDCVWDENMQWGQARKWQPNRVKRRYESMQAIPPAGPLPAIVWKNPGLSFSS